jgi:putative lipoprotein
LLVLAALTVVAGCQREATPPATASTTPAGMPPAPATAPAPADAESSLLIKRGTVSLTAETRVLRLCGQTEDLWLVQQDDQSFDDTYAKLAGEQSTPLFVEVRGERIAAPQGTVIPVEFKQAFILEELLYAGVPTEGGGCAAPAPAYRVLARGNEPFWSVEIDDDQLLLRQADAAAAAKFSVQETQDAEGSVTYRGISGNKTLEITVTNSPCSDSMSGEYFAYMADLTLEGRTLRGCARVGE